MECRVTKSFFSFSVDSARLCGNFCPSVGPGLEGSLAGDKGVHQQSWKEKEREKASWKVATVVT